MLKEMLYGIKKGSSQKGPHAVFPAIRSSPGAMRCEAQPEHLLEGLSLLNKLDQLCNNGSTLIDVAHICRVAPQALGQLQPPPLRVQLDTPLLEKSISLPF